MAITMYSASVPVYVQLLTGLKTVLEKGEAYVQQRKLDPAIVLNLRLYPDMFPLARQIRQVCEHALSAGRAAGVEVPKLPDLDSSFEEMKARINKTIDFLKTLTPAQLDGKEDSMVTVVLGGQPRQFKAQNLVFHTAMPNFYFHCTTAYNILRELGIEIGKSDFMGPRPQ